MGIYLTNNEISNTLFIYGFYEENETEMFEKIIKAGDTVLDIGANIGYYTLIFAKLVGKNGRVFAFEPEPTNFTLLRRNIRINSYDNVVLEQKAVSNKTGKVKLYISENPGLHRIYDSYDGRKFIEVEAICLDDYFKNYDKNIDVIKMDIEGSEFGAVQGMTSLLKKNKNVKIVTEFLPSGLRQFGIKPEEYIELLIKCGFDFLYNIKRKRILKNEDIAKLPTEYASSETNLLCMKRSL
jgi:FkbM family methyltransferase